MTLPMGFYRDQVVPRLTDLALSGKEFTAIRARVTTTLEGRVLEVGFGSGRNVPHYPPTVKQVQAIDPSRVGQTLAHKRVSASAVSIEFVGLDGEHLPVDDNSIDHVLTTWTLCTIPDPHRALTEIYRVLRPAGGLHFVEHGRAPDDNVARRQDRFTPIQRRIFGGCHLNRPIAELIADAGLAIEQLDNYYTSGPKMFGYMYEGIAIKP